MHQLRFGVVVAAAAVAWGPGTESFAQTAPVNGIRPADVRTHAIVNTTVVAAPGRTLENATIVIRDGIVESVGETVVVPPEARVWSGEGLTVYPGLIDAAVLIEIAEPPDDRGAHWNERVHPQIRMADQPPPDASLRKELRSLGFTAAAVYPSGGILRGSGTVIALADEDEHVLAYDEHAAMAVGFGTRGGFGSASYPGSLMGAITLIRQTLYDARWHAERLRVWQRDPLGHEPPEPADALVALADAIA
ncbi:MAG: amidohydrolase family protein, partial [Planctomycetota bacterium]